MVEIPIGKYTCPKCGEEYTDSAKGNFPGKPCKNCFELMKTLKTVQTNIAEINQQIKAVGKDAKMSEDDKKVALVGLNQQLSAKQAEQAEIEAKLSKK